MKKLLAIAILGVTGALFACNNSQDVKSPEPDVASITGKVIQMDKQMFLDRVYNYELNPKEWVFAGNKPVIIDFYADWCKPCQIIAPIMDELAKDYSGQIDIYKVDTDKQQELASAFGIQSIPAILFVPKTGTPQMYTGAFQKDEYHKIIKEKLLITQNEQL